MLRVSVLGLKGSEEFLHLVFQLHMGHSVNEHVTTPPLHPLVVCVCLCVCVCMRACVCVSTSVCPSVVSS